MLTLVILSGGALLAASLPLWLPTLVIALRMRIFARINGQQAIAIPGDLVDASRFKQVYSDRAADGRSRGAALSDLFWYWLSPGPEIHQEHIEPGERYEEVARTTRRILALPRKEAEELTADCVGRVFSSLDVRNAKVVRLRELMMPVWAEFYYEVVFGQRCTAEARELIVNNANDVVTALKCCGLRHMEKRDRLTQFLIAKVEAGEAAHRLPECLSIREQALYLQGVFFNTAVVQMSEAMAHLLMALAQHPEVQARFAACPEDDQYLDFVISETLRLYPLFGIAHRISSADIAVDEHTTIPRGSVLCFNYPEFQHTGFEHPERFDPSRWEHLSPRHENYIPFGIPANRPCPALGLAPLTMKVVAREIVKRYTLHSSASHTRSIPNRGPCLLAPRTAEVNPRLRGVLLSAMRLRDRWEDVWNSLVQLVLGTYMVLDARKLRLCERYFERAGGCPFASSKRPANTRPEAGRKEMEAMNEADLLRACVQRLGSELSEDEEQALRHWWQGKRQSAAALTGKLLARPERDWTEVILEHRAHQHAWYDQLAHEVSVEEFAAFLLENWAFPPFLALVERALEAQICDEGRAAVQRNIDDEQVPTPHAELMRRLMSAVKARAGDSVRLESFPSLIDRTLVFYYGYYCDPWHLVGSLYVTETLAHHRMAGMEAGLTRLGFQPEDLEYIYVHLKCDDDHARDWIDGVIEPSVRLDPKLRTPIAEGIASCLDTSARYLDHLSRRAHERVAVYST